jgi:DNA polymerase III sliding clamp (beta) subunit (PCNA family)
MIVSRYHLSVAVKAASRIIQRGPKVTYDCVRLSDDDGRLAVSATNHGERVALPVEVAEGRPGDPVLLNAARLSQVLGAIDGDAVTITRAKNGDIDVSGNGTRFRVSAYADDWPETPVVGDATDSQEVDGPTLAAHLRSVLRAVATENSRYAINGVLFSGPHIVATDGRRMAIAGLPHDTGMSAIVSRSMIQTVLAIDADAWEIRHDKTSIEFRSDAGVVVGSLVEGTFPAWRDVIPKHDDSVRVDVADLRRAMETARVVANAEVRGARITFQGGTATVTAADGMGGEAECVLPLAGVGLGRDLAIGMNPSYVVDAIAHLPGDAVVTMWLGRANQPVLFECDGYRHVVMPVSLT